MTEQIAIIVDGQHINVKKGINLVDALNQVGIDVPTLCYSNDQPCLGTCRVCTGKVNNRNMALCTLNVEQGMDIKLNTDTLNDARKALVELLFVEGNHFCPGCEKSGDCQLQSLAYQMRMSVSRFPYRFTPYDLDYRGQWLVLEHNRCIHCKRCTDLFRDDEGHQVFAFEGKGGQTVVKIDLKREKKLTKEKAEEAVKLCPTGAILFKGRGFDRPYGKREFDHEK